MEMRNSQGLTEEEFLELYDSSKYRKPSVTVDNIVFCLGNKRGKTEEKDVSYLNHDVEVLIIKRGNHPDMGRWAFPGGFIEMDENLETSALRELKEETGLEGIEIEQLQAFGDVGRDKRDRIVTVAFLSVIEQKKTAEAGDDAQDAKWFSLKCKKEAVDEESYILDIILENEKIQINTKVKVIKKKGQFMENKTYEIMDKSQMASDHSKILAVAVERLKSLGL